MKGITPVVAIILLLLITISMVGFAFVWFTRVGESTTQQTQEQLQSQLNATSQKIRIESIYKGSAASTEASYAVIRNIGSAPISLKSITGFRNGANAGCRTARDYIPTEERNKPFTDATTALQLNFVLICNMTDPDAGGPLTTICATGDKIKITAPGNSDELSCP